MKSWVESANSPDCHFPLQNLPFGAAKFCDGDIRCVTAIGDKVVDLALLETEGLLSVGGEMAVFDRSCINAFMALGVKSWRQVRSQLTQLLDAEGDTVLQNDSRLREIAIVPMNEVTMQMPFEVAEFTDFYAGKQHAENMGKILRGTSDLPANWLHIPIGYNGRASSVVVSGTDIVRPNGQTKASEAATPEFGPTKRLDIELELGAVIGTSSKLGQPITVAQADEMIFGYVLLNDWSARDIQAWEYQPLGPFQGKAFATSIGAWVVTSLALEEFRRPTPSRVKPLLPYLDEEKPGLYDIHLEIYQQAQSDEARTKLAETNYSRMYYSAAQQLCHHAIGGCKMNSGDLLGSGTISGPEPGEFGSLMEIGWAGQKPFKLSGGKTRSFVEDGDQMTLTGWAQGDGYKIGFGECRGKVLPAISWPNT